MRSIIKALLILLLLGVCPLYASNETVSVSLNEIISLAVKNSPELLLAQEDIVKAENDLKLAKKQYIPKISIQGSVGVDLLSLDDFNSNNLGSDLILDWDFFQNGMLIFRIKQARSDVESAKLQKGSVQQELVYTIKQMSIDLRSKIDDLELARESLELERARFELIKEEFKAGSKTRTEVMRKQAVLFNVENDVRSKARAVEAARKKMEQKTGVLVDSIFIDEPEDLTAFSFEKPDSEEEALQIAMDNRGDLRKLELQWNMSKLGVKLAKWKRWPQLQMFAGSAFALDDFNNQSEKFEFRTGMIVRYPIYDGGQIKSQIDAARIQEHKAALSVENTQKRIFNEVSDSHFALESAMASFEGNKIQYEILSDEMEKAGVEYDEGRISRHEWDEAKLNFMRVEYQLKKSWRSVMDARAYLAKTQGLLWYSEKEGAMAD